MPLDAVAEAINRGVNDSISPSTDTPGAELLQFWPRVGFCHDYAVTNQKLLKCLGIDSRLCEVKLADGSHHLVATVGNPVLDTLRPVIGPMRYTIVRIRSADDPKSWDAQ